MTPEESCARIHALLASLPLARIPDATVPANGLYFHYEDGETEAHRQGPRVVRVGNHPRTQGGLPSRLRNHYSGSKNGSVFRKLLGGALLRRADAQDPCLAPRPGQGHWEKQDQPSCPRCRPTEHAVSALLRTHFAVRCMQITDKQERNYLEERLIATLGACPRCRQSPSWLGTYAYNQVVQSSGMWLSRGIDAQVMTAADMARFEVLVLGTRALAGGGAA